MQIYDRYNGDPTAERRRYAKRRRYNLRRIYKLAERSGLASMIVSLLLLAVAAKIDSIPAWMFVLIAICALPWLVAAVLYFVLGEDTTCDLYIYGMEDGRFLMLNPLYEVMRRVSPEEIREIRIIPAMWPTTRQQQVSGKRRLKENINFEPWGENREIEWEKQLAPHPMAVLYTGDEPVDWCHTYMVEDADWRYQHVPSCRTPLQKYLSIVPMGENAMPFAFALRQSSCLVKVAGNVYGDHRVLLDAIFAQSGMDMNRLTIEWDPE